MLLFPSFRNWGKHVMAESQSPNIQPRALQRELSSVLHLFKEANFEGVTNDQGSKLNMSKIVSWFAPAMANYCRIFGMKEDCGNDKDGIRSGCNEANVLCQAAKKMCLGKKLTEAEFANGLTRYKCDCQGTVYTCLLYTSDAADE